MDGFGAWDWLGWVGLAVVLGIVEVATLDLVFAMLAVGALAGAGTALATDNVAGQVLVTLAVALGMLFVVRPVALRHLRTPAALRTGVAALVGERAVVLEPVDADGGRVRLKGEVWSARTAAVGRSIAVGAAVQVVQIDGATAVVDEPEV